MTTDRDALTRAGILPGRELVGGEREYLEARVAKLAARGKPHGLTAEESSPPTARAWRSNATRR